MTVWRTSGCMPEASSGPSSAGLTAQGPCRRRKSDRAVREAAGHQVPHRWIDWRRRRGSCTVSGRQSARCWVRWSRGRRSCAGHRARLARATSSATYLSRIRRSSTRPMTWRRTKSASRGGLLPLRVGTRACASCGIRLAHDSPSARGKRSCVASVRGGRRVASSRGAGRRGRVGSAVTDRRARVWTRDTAVPAKPEHLVISHSGGLRGRCGR